LLPLARHGVEHAGVHKRTHRIRRAKATLIAEHVAGSLAGGIRRPTQVADTFPNSSNHLPYFAVLSQKTLVAGLLPGNYGRTDRPAGSLAAGSLASRVPSGRFGSQ
jgi:hypothetical protein